MNNLDELLLKINELEKRLYFLSKKISRLETEISEIRNS